VGIIDFLKPVAMQRVFSFSRRIINTVTKNKYPNKNRRVFLCSFSDVYVMIDKNTSFGGISC